MASLLFVLIVTSTPNMDANEPLLLEITMATVNRHCERAERLKQFAERNGANFMQITPCFSNDAQKKGSSFVCIPKLPKRTVMAGSTRHHPNC
jgi:hypothetical protein